MMLRYFHGKNAIQCQYVCLRTFFSRIASEYATLSSTIKTDSAKMEKVHGVQPHMEDAVKSTIKELSKSKISLTAPQFCTTLTEKQYADIGQPTPFSHPHLFEKENEITPGITGQEYASRRLRLMRLLSESTVGSGYRNHLFVLAAASLKIMSNDIPYPFHQDTDFLYLTGLNEPDALLALDFNTATKSSNFLLFVAPKNPRRELWDGAVVGDKQAVAYFNADEAFPLKSFESVLHDRYDPSEYCIWYRKKQQGNNFINEFLTKVQSNGQEIQDILYNLQMLRLIKSYSERALMKLSVSIASKAFAKVMKHTKPGLPESHLHATLSYECQLQGAQHLSFPPVVAGGDRANTLHYINNTQILRDGDLVLMDGGCEYNGFASDLTRTWPVNGTFSDSQRELYEIVLRVQDVCLQECKLGVSIDHLNQIMLINLGKELQRIGLISPNSSENELKRKASVFCPHHLGHYLGMDTHDTHLLHRGLPLQTGMVLTLEPGIYIPKTSINVPERYRGIGIRIEDNILMTSSGPCVLSAELPKQVKDIEELMKEKP